MLLTGPIMLNISKRTASFTFWSSSPTYSEVLACWLLGFDSFFSSAAPSGLVSPSVAGFSVCSLLLVSSAAAGAGAAASAEAD